MVLLYFEVTRKRLSPRPRARGSAHAQPSLYTCILHESGVGRTFFRQHSFTGDEMAPTTPCCSQTDQIVRYSS